MCLIDLHIRIELLGCILHGKLLHGKHKPQGVVVSKMHGKWDNRTKPRCTVEMLVETTSSVTEGKKLFSPKVHLR